MVCYLLPGRDGPRTHFAGKRVREMKALTQKYGA